jgi:hexokinase
MQKSVSIAEYKKMRSGKNRRAGGLPKGRISKRKAAVLKNLDARIDAGEKPTLSQAEMEVLLSQDYNKHGNTIIETPEGLFHSTGELERWDNLKLMQAGGLICELERQKTLELSITTEFGTFLISTIIMDFVYRKAEDGSIVFEDFKGHRTKDYLIKRKLVKAIFGVQIFETGEKDIKRRKKKCPR